MWSCLCGEGQDLKWPLRREWLLREAENCRLSVRGLVPQWYRWGLRTSGLSGFCVEQNPWCRQRCLLKASPSAGRECEALLFPSFIFYSLFSLLLFPHPWNLLMPQWIFCVFGNKKLCPQLPWNSLQVITTTITPASPIMAFPSWNALSELLFNMEFGTAQGRMSPMGSQDRRGLDGLCLLQCWSWLRVWSPPKTPGAQTDRAWVVLCSAPLHLCVPPLVIFSEGGEYQTPINELGRVCGVQHTQILRESFVVTWNKSKYSVQLPRFPQKVGREAEINHW